jgi:hypothetical protein
MATAQSRHECAARLLAAAAVIRETYHVDMAPDERTEYDAALHSIRAQLDPASFDAAWAAGRTLDDEQAVALAFAREASS